MFKSTPETQLVINNLRRNGFAKGTGTILTPAELAELEQIVDDLHSNPEVNKNYAANAPVVVGLANRDDRLDKLLEKILTSESVRYVLLSVLGDDYKVWQINSRISEHGDRGLDLHQDSPGETNFSFLVSTQKSSAGMTAFLPKSHLIARWTKHISWSHIRLARYFLCPLVGQSGEHAFFFNKTWHARLPNNKNISQKVILMSFFPVGGRYSPDLRMTNLKASFFYPELKRVLSTKDGVTPLSDGSVEVVSMQKVDKICSAQEIERNSYLSLANGQLYVRLALLELVFRPLRGIYRLFMHRRAKWNIGSHENSYNRR